MTSQKILESYLENLRKMSKYTNQKYENMSLHFIYFLRQECSNFTWFHRNRVLTRLSLFTNFTWENIYIWKTHLVQLPHMPWNVFSHIAQNIPLTSCIFSCFDPSLQKAFNLLLLLGSLWYIPRVRCFSDEQNLLYVKSVISTY